MSCSKEVTKDILQNCAITPKKGIEGGKGVLINWGDIDRASSKDSGATVTDLVLLASKTGLRCEWYKDLASASSTYTPSAEDVDGFSHAFMTRLSTSSAENAERANELKAGRFVMVYETKFKGEGNKEAFKIAGWQSGLKLSEMTTSTNENSGATLFTLSSEDGDIEQYPFNVFLEGGDFATSKATFESLFANL